MAAQKVLIVDDEFSIRDMLRMALEISDFECLEAENIQDAHRIIVDERPSIVLLDWMLPGGSGLELLRRLKRSDTTAEIPVIMLTAKAAEENIVQGLDVGADDYVIKPFAPRELIARIKALLRRIQAVDERGRLDVVQLVLDVDCRRLFVAKVPIEFGPTAFNLL